ncbi:MAG: hypothetical protein JO166_02955 [Deltaproteobacteria bacterium]|nr:hypothetical protein [Deltaproteobacteria bacterium]
MFQRGERTSAISTIPLRQIFHESGRSAAIIALAGVLPALGMIIAGATTLGHPHVMIGPWLIVFGVLILVGMLVAYFVVAMMVFSQTRDEDAVMTGSGHPEAKYMGDRDEEVKRKHEQLQ